MRQLPGEDIEATAVMPQLDIRILSAALERVEHSDTPAPVVAVASPEWKVSDQLAALQDQVASLQAELQESENRYTRLAMRHETLLQKFEERDAVQTGLQLALNQTRNQVAALEQELQQLNSDAVDLRQSVAMSIKQRRQHEQFILKQADEIKRLRKLIP